MWDRVRAQDGAVPADGPPWLVALGILATLAGTTAPIWGPALAGRARAGTTTATPTPDEEEGAPVARQDATLALLERMIADLQEATRRLREELAEVTERETALRIERDALRKDLLAAQRERDRYRWQAGGPLRMPTTPEG